MASENQWEFARPAQYKNFVNVDIRSLYFLADDKIRSHGTWLDRGHVNRKLSATFNPSTNSISNAVFMFKLILDKKNFHPGGVIDNGEEIMFERKRCKLGIIKQMTKEFSGVNWTSEKHTLLLNRTRALDPGITGARIRLIF